MKSRFIALLFTTAAAVLFPQLAVTGSPRATAPDPPPLDGTWLPDSVSLTLDRYMNTWVTIAGNQFTIHHYWDYKTDWTGTFTIADDGTPGHLLLTSNGLSFAEHGMSGGFPACKLPGIYKLDGDRLAVNLAAAEHDARPTDFTEAKHRITTVFKRAPQGWTGFPKTIKVAVLDPDGKPAPAAKLFGFLNRQRPSKPSADGKSYYVDTTQPAHLYTSVGIKDWPGTENLKPDGTTTLPYAIFTQQDLPIGARDADRCLIGIEKVSPARLSAGELTIHLQPQRIVRGQIDVEGERPKNDPVWRAAYLSRWNDRFAFSEAPAGEFEFIVPPGQYQLYRYGNDLVSLSTTIDVPAGRDVLQLPSITLRFTESISRIGKPAPPLVQVAGWKNSPVTLADLKGKVILLDFWGYWCGNCVVDMPKIIRLHEKFKDKGLAIVSIHVDENGEVDTAEKLDARTKLYRNGTWKGKDLSFPVALCHGAHKSQNDTPAAYGIQYYPTLIFIDRAGNILGSPGQKGLGFNIEDDTETDTEIEKLLAKK